MPNWKTHIEIGKKLNEYLKYDEEQLNIFLLGNILPDVNNGYILTNISKKIDYDITHIGSFIKPSHIDFYNKYKNEIDNKVPIFLGYLVHLYTDYNWNINYYENIKKLNIQKENRDELRIIKQNDFKVYNNKFIKNIIRIENIDLVLNKIQKIHEISITKDDILKIIDFLYNQKSCKEKLQFYSEKQLDEIMNNTVKSCISFFENI